MADWTKAQLKAIETENKTLLVSAAAGSGKTTVLIERLIRSLTDKEHPTEISRLLIVTFTKSAASELKQRISAAISSELAKRPQDTRLFKQLSSLGSAHISTIDSFYSDVVRRNAQILGIPGNIRIADKSELIKLRRKAMNEVIDMGYAGELAVSSEEFALVADALGDMRNDASLCDILYNVYENLLRHPKSIDFLCQCAESYEKSEISDFFDSDYGKIIKEYVSEELKFLIRLLNDAVDYFSPFPPKVQEAYVGDLVFCKNALSKLENSSYTKTRAFFNTYSPADLKSPPKDERTDQSEYFADLRNKMVKPKIRKLQAAYFGAGFSEKELRLYASESARRVKTLYAILYNFDKTYRAEKLTQNICEFNDIKLWAHQLLVNDDGTPTELAKGIADSFDCVYIDEYQDVDNIQDRIFRAISKPRGRFMVGDVKQSIYSFRGAEPSLFMKYREEFATIDAESEKLPQNDDCTIFMSENFRCDITVVECANEICSYLFRTAGKKVKYKDEDNLVFAKPTKAGHETTKAKMVLIDRKASKTKLPDAEALFVAAEIKRLISEEKKADGSPIAPYEIAVISRKHKFGGLVSAALDRYGIPHTSQENVSIFDDPDVSLTVSLLNVIDNPMRDIHTAAVMMSPLFGFDADMLIKLRGKNEITVCALYDSVCSYAEKDNELAKRCRNFISVISELREEAISLSADKVIRLVFSRFSLLSKGNSRPYLLRLYENARSYEGDSFKGLYGYLKHVDEMMSNGISPEGGGEDASNGVHIITMHESKGLEYPICFVSACGLNFNRDDSRDPILYSQDLGIAMDLIDETGFGQICTPYRKALERHIFNESAEEEMRILYVALTRARERLYITADPQFGAERELKIAKTFAQYGGYAGVINSTNFISWILTARAISRKDFCKLSVISYDDIPPLPIQNTTSDAHPEDIPVDALIYDQIKENLGYEYPYLHIANIPAKLSVSRLSPNVLDRTFEISPEDESLSTIDIALPKITTAPSFIDTKRTIGAAEKGTATHTFLQFCDFNNLLKGTVEDEILRLTDKKFITKEMGAMIDISQIEAFSKSKLFEEIINAKKVFQEKRFNILLPASEFTQDDEYAKLIGDQKLLVQGVIDIFFEDRDGKLTLCDYKTDQLTEKELNDETLAKKKLSQAHSRQLSYYSAALESILGKKPDRVLIYSLPLGKYFEINV